MKLTVIGGGGFRVPQVFEAASDPSAPVHLDEVALYDVDATRLTVMSKVLAKRAESLENPPRLVATTDLDEALRGASFVFCAIRPGGTEGRILDERTALNLGVLGQETTGPGGLAYALRSVPVMTRIAERVRAVAPDAWFINFTNPAGIVTESLRRVLGDRVVGICDTPIGLMRRAGRVLGVSDPEFDYVGLNHLGWLRSVGSGGVNRLPELIADDAALDDIEEARLMGFDWVRALGALPNEYLYYYYYNREAVSRIRTVEQTRGEFLRDQQGRFYLEAAAEGADPLAVWNRTHEERDATYMAESRPEGEEDARRSDDIGGGYHQVALDLMAALATGRPATMILNVANSSGPHGALVSQLPDEAVVEVGCRVDADGVHPWAVAPVTGHMAALMASVKTVEQLTIEAALTGSRDLAWKAFSLHPLVDSVNVGKALLEGYEQAFPGLLDR